LPHFKKTPYRKIKIETLYENGARNGFFGLGVWEDNKIINI